MPDLAEETFQGLLLQARGRTGLTQREVARRLGMHTRSVQGWESGANHPTAESLQLLLAAYLAANGFTAANEQAEAAALWAAAERETSRLRLPFDAQWFGDLVEQQAAARGRRSVTEPDSARRPAPPPLPAKRPV